MPFVVIHTLERTSEQKKQAIAAATEAVASAYECSPEIVTCYIHEHPESNYGHAGVQGPDCTVRRVFAELHAFPRDMDKKRRVVKGLTDALVNAFDAPPKEVIVYIVDREKFDAAHGGILISDSEQSS